MKKYLLLLLFIPLVSYTQITVSGQKPTYSNPYPEPIKVQVQANPYTVPTASTPIIINKNSAPRSKPESNNFFPLSINIEEYTHIAIVDVLQSNGGRAAGAFKRVANALKGSKLTLLNPTDNKRKFKANTFYLRDIKNPNWLYLYYVGGYSGNNVVVNVILTDSENNKVFEKSTTNMPWRSTLAQIANFTKQDQVVKAPSENLQTKLENIKEKAVKELKELKNLLDLELITQTEFDNKSKELKKIILDN